MKKTLAGLLAAVLVAALLLCAGCISTNPGASTGPGFTDPVLGTWKMDVGNDFSGFGYYMYTFSNDLTGNEILVEYETNEVYSESPFTWIIHNDVYKTEPKSQITNKGEQFTISADGKVLTDTLGLTYHKV